MKMMITIMMIIMTIYFYDKKMTDVDDSDNDEQHDLDKNAV